MVTLANGFAARGYAVDLVLASAVGPYLKDVAPAVRVVDLRAGRVIKALWPLVRYLRRERPHAMLSAMNHANVVAILARRLAAARTRLVVSERTTISVEVARARGLAARAVYALVPRLYPKADGIVAVSRDAARDLERFARLPSGTVRAIYNPFDLERIAQLAQEPVPHPWLQPGQVPVVVAIGRLTEEKNFTALLQAFAQLRARKEARLLILGEGELREELEQLSHALGLGPDALQMPGFVANPFAYLARAALFVLSSRWEGLPGVLIEAMACGTPVVSTDCPSGPREILEDGRWGRLVPVGDVAALARAMEEVLSTPKDRLPDVRQRARDFDQARAIDAYLEAMNLPPWADECEGGR
ncbi:MULTISPECIES: glycosyltransferase [unclassified Thermosynechococcus]|uniref:glycosyltransferase n=1 Tax=unclassified Thermosynechococcus TaxID=2622553 RepID=UPI002673CDBE|nr:glycosyltransferase [Thermosynechococcus sp. HY596]WNC62114.1 glycosyltransferase [Thermosynechococcus sp. HY591]WNC64667.1 glycosyltransferase [Thermosynechococcus sp. HY593]